MVSTTRRTADPIVTGWVESLAVNGEPKRDLPFFITGPAGDRHSGFIHSVSGHDGGYVRTSALEKGDSPFFNFRSWTALSREELSVLQIDLGVDILPGLLLENLIVSGIPNFSQLAPTSRLVFPVRTMHGGPNQAILAVWEENEPCKVVGKRLADHYCQPRLERDFVIATQRRRGLMGIVLSPGWVEVGDKVLVYPPLQYGA